MKSAILGLFIYAFFMTTAKAELLDGTRGGGGLFAPNGLTEKEGLAIVQRTRSALFFYANFLKDKTSGKALTLSHQKLFSGTTTIFDVLRKQRIYLEKAGPCKDLDGAMVDGSIVSPKTNTICLSMNSITTKLRKPEAWSQILALAWHEFSHQLGATEEEARELQREAIAYLENSSSQEWSLIHTRLVGHMWELSVESGFKKLRDMDLDAKCEATSKYLSSLPELRSIYDTPDRQRFYFERFKQEHDVLIRKMQRIRAFYCVEAPSVPEERRIFMRRALYWYYDTNQVNAGEFEFLAERVARWESQYVMRRLDNETVVEKEIADVTKIVKDEKDYIDNLPSITIYGNVDVF